MGDSILNFNDLGDLDYTGLSDTGAGYTGSSTLQDVQLGSPLLLDSTYGPSTASVTDGMNWLDTPSTPVGSGTVLLPTSTPATSQSLSGVSNPPFASSPQSTPTPGVGQMSASSAAGVTALSKFGASLASIFSGPATVVAPAKGQTQTIAGAALPATSSTTTVILLVVVVAMVVLLLRSE
jgi:hypothetical protein